MYRSEELTLILVVLLALLLAACGGSPDYLLIGTARAPSADGTVQVDDIGGDGGLVTVHMERLPPPRHLGEGNTAYMVWFEATGKTIKAGELDYKVTTRTGDLMKPCPFGTFKLKITAESKPDAERPSDFVIAEQTISFD